MLVTLKKLICYDVGMNRVAVVGLGIMGHGIADNFLKTGYSVTLWNRTKDKADDLLARGAKWADTPAQAAQDADIVFEVTANNESSREVWLGKDGILSKGSSDQPKFLITSATLSVDWVQELAQKADSPNTTFFDMPMTGGRIAAESGQLTLLVGGDETILDQLRPDLEAIAKDVKYFGSDRRRYQV